MCAQSHHHTLRYEVFGVFVWFSYPQYVGTVWTYVCVCARKCLRAGKLLNAVYCVVLRFAVLCCTVSIKT